ncbi:hypothetical protein BJ508DRAFT_371432 [Ascobolus immersus RN42]|uniref:C3H1-type domain-containing protein n=1 Tax=Ascobolus immersus RN42 TaxID=1160509 RepID=A0A3N4IP22_ASCIM|nr:hypothetical protein BJ508DRAFT_371432 [Ascobolus immersus RN42]
MTNPPYPDGPQHAHPQSPPATRPLAPPPAQHLPHAIVSTHTLITTDSDGLTLQIPLVRADQLPTYIQVATPSFSSSQSKVLGHDFCYNQIMAYLDGSATNADGHGVFNPAVHEVWREMDVRRPVGWGGMMAQAGYGQCGVGAAAGLWPDTTTHLGGLDVNGGLDFNNLNAVLGQLSLNSQEPHSHPETQDFAARQSYLLSQGLYRKEPCNAFRQKGHCKWGDKCTYSHEAPTSAPPVQQALDHRLLPLLQSALFLQQQQQQAHSSHPPIPLSPPRLVPTAPPYKPQTPYRPPPLSRTTSTPTPAPQKGKGLKTHCTYFLRTGQCDFMQQGCKFSHERPEDPILRTVNNETIVVVPGKKSGSSSPESGLSTKGRNIPINFGRGTLSRQASTETGLTTPSPGREKEQYSPLGGLHPSRTQDPLFAIFNPPRAQETPRRRTGTVSSSGLYNVLAEIERQQGGSPQATATQKPVGSGRFEGKQSRIWGENYRENKERRERQRRVEIMDGSLPDSEEKGDGSRGGSEPNGSPVSSQDEEEGPGAAFRFGGLKVKGAQERRGELISFDS